MKLRVAKKIHKRWLVMMNYRYPWRKVTLDRALELWLYKSLRPKHVSTHAWEHP